jgi:hypothetical protein
LNALAYNFAIFDDHESALLGCVYVEPPREGRERVATVSWWVVDDEVGSDLDEALATAVPEWLARHWPFTSVRYCVESQFS